MPDAYMRTIMPLSRLLTLAQLFEKIPNERLGGRVDVIVEMKVGMQLVFIGRLEYESDITLRLFSGLFDVGCGAHGLHACASRCLP